MNGKVNTIDLKDTNSINYKIYEYFRILYKS